MLQTSENLKIVCVDVVVRTEGGWLWGAAFMHDANGVLVWPLGRKLGREAG